MNNSATTKPNETEALFPRPIKKAIEQCLILHKEVLLGKASLSEEVQCTVDKMVSVYLRDILKDYETAYNNGQADSIIDGEHTASQICEQNILLINKKLESYLLEIRDSSNTGILAQRKFLMTHLAIDELPEVTTAENFNHAEKTTEKMSIDEALSEAGINFNPTTDTAKKDTQDASQQDILRADMLTIDKDIQNKYNELSPVDCESKEYSTAVKQLVKLVNKKRKLIDKLEKLQKLEGKPKN